MNDWATGSKKKVNVHKILTVIGTRPEAIKLAPVIMELQRHKDQFISLACVTGQHREMLDQVLELFDITPDDDLNIMSSGQSLAWITSRAVEGLDKIINDQCPDVVLVQGDTTTALCGAMAAFYHKVKVGHVEAGLRTYDKYSPFPEEMNRQLIGRLATYHFTPTERAKSALLSEGVSGKSVFVTGNTVIDALLWVRDRFRFAPPELPAPVSAAAERYDLILVTGHRRESFGPGFENICHAIRDVADTFANVAFVYPVHLNPNVREPVWRILGGHERIYLIEPLPYISFVWLMDKALLVLTDSGGVQEEAPALGKPVLVMRETTERPEGIAAGNARLVGVRRDRIVTELARLLRQPEERISMASVRNPYGDGTASRKIVDILSNAL